MKSTKKIEILSADEMRQEKVNVSTDPSTGICNITAQCSNGDSVSCSGTECTEIPGLVNGKWVVLGVQCDKTPPIMCEYGVGASGAEQACIGVPVGEHCEWLDDTGLMHYGFCQYDINSSPMKAICVEPSGSGSGN